MDGEYAVDGLAVPESLNLLHELLEKVAQEHPDVAAADIMMFETAVIEIAGNVVEHGRPPGEVTYGFRIEVHPDRLEGVLTDSGEELPPTSEAEMPDLWDESGRGLALAGSVLDELEYTRAEGTNRWLMRRLRRAQV